MTEGSEGSPGSGCGVKSSQWVEGSVRTEAASFGRRPMVSHEVSAKGLGERPGAHTGGSGGPEVKTQGRNRKELTI